MPLTVALKSEFFKWNWLFLQLDLGKSLRIKRLLNSRTGVFRKDCVGAGARPGQTFLWIILLSDSEGRRACLCASLSIWRDCHFNETDLALHQQTVSDELFSLSSSSQRKWDKVLAEPVIYLLLKVFDPSLVDTLFSSYAFSPLIPTAMCQGALMAFLSLSQPLRLPFYTTVVVEVKWSEMEKNKRRICFGLDCTKQALSCFFLLLSYSCDARFFWWNHCYRLICLSNHLWCSWFVCYVTVWVKNKHRPLKQLL